MTILSIAYPFAPVGPHAIGGAEQILSDLDEALVAAGHVSLVVASKGSATAGHLFAAALPGQEMLDDADREWCRHEFQGAIDRALISRRVDLIHAHGMDFCEYAFPPDIPLLVTLHLPPEWYGLGRLEKYAGRAQFCCVSQTQRRSGMAQWSDVAVIEDGVALSPFECGTHKSDLALVLGRICPEKNAHIALEAGTRSNTRVVLAGHIFPYRAHRQYFEEKIQPLLKKSDGPAHEFAGPVFPEQRQRLVAHAKCLLHPTLAPETSSLVAMEALAA